MTADKLTFNVTKLTTQEGVEYNSTILDQTNNLYGLQSETVKAWWDTFTVELLTSDSATVGSTSVAFNVTYLLIPEEGLTLTEGAAYSNETSLYKTVTNAEVAVNGVRAEQTSPGVYDATVGVWEPTAYIHVAVSQNNWTTTHSGFSFPHEANIPIWGYSIVAASIIVACALLAKLVLFKNQSAPSVKHDWFPAIGASLLAAASAISVYWGLVGIDGSLDGFEWLILAVFSLISGGFGFAGALNALWKKNQAFVILTVVLPLVVNVVVVKGQIDAYLLLVPWISIVASILLAVSSGLILCNSDQFFEKKSTDDL